MTCCQVRAGAAGAGGTGESKEIKDLNLFVCVLDAAGTHFKRIIPDDGSATVQPEKVKRVVFCTGKIYYELIRERQHRGLDGAVAVVRIEQVTPCD